MADQPTKGFAWTLSIAYLGGALFLFWLFGLGGWPLSGTDLVASANWDRSLVIFNALSAIGFAAIGVLLGTKVQEVNVAKAETDKEKAKASEANLAGHSRELSNAAKEVLRKAEGLKASSKDFQAVGSGSLRDGGDEARLHRAIDSVDALLSQRQPDDRS